MSKKLLTADTQVYSSEEIFTGKYWFGKKVYRKTISGTEYSSSTDISISHGISNIGNYIMFVPEYSCWMFNENEWWNFNGYTHESAFMNITSINRTIIAINRGSSWIMPFSYYITLEYTKTTD